MAKVKRFEHLAACKLRLWWAKDWKADQDGIAIGAQVCKANEVDRLLVEENNGESPDIFIKLPKDQWPHLDETEKEHRLYHELCHIRPALDANGKQKRDAKDRLLWRLGRHPIACFHEELERFGAERVLGHNAAIVKSAEVAERPLIAAFDAAEAKAANGSDSWKRLPLGDLRLPQPVEAYLVSAGFDDIGKLSDHMSRAGDFWDVDVKVGGQRKPPGFRVKIEDAFSEFWATYPEFCK